MGYIKDFCSHPIHTLYLHISQKSISCHNTNAQGTEY